MIDDYPLPTKDDPVSNTFWDAAADHRLIYQHCNACNTPQFFPRSWCQYCGSDRIKWLDSDGVGTIHTFTVIRRATELPQFAQKVPYVVAYIDLEEGFRMCSNVINCNPDDVFIEMPVELVFDDVTDTISIPKFQPRNV